MTLAETPLDREYSLSDCAAAALAGAVANGLALGLLSPDSLVGGFFLSVLLFGIGYAVLAVAGRPMARNLASDSRDTLLNGFLLGAATGSLTGTLLAGVIASFLFGSPSAAFSFFTPLFGLFGVFAGAAMGLSFVWVGRRRFAALGFKDVERQEEAHTRVRFRWSWVVIAIGFGLPAMAVVSLGAQEKPRLKSFPIAGTIYDWPAGTTVLPPRPPRFHGAGYVRYRSSARHSNPEAFLIIYDGNAQEPLNEAGLPGLQMITSRFDKHADFSFRTTPVGRTVCNRRKVQVGLAFPCGLSFVHRGARWELHFGAHQEADAEQLHREAIRRLESFRHTGENHPGVEETRKAPELKNWLEDQVRVGHETAPAIAFLERSGFRCRTATHAASWTTERVVSVHTCGKTVEKEFFSQKQVSTSIWSDTSGKILRADFYIRSETL